MTLGQGNADFLSLSPLILNAFVQEVPEPPPLGVVNDTLYEFESLILVGDHTRNDHQREYVFLGQCLFPNHFLEDLGQLIPVGLLGPTPTGWRIRAVKAFDLQDIPLHDFD